MSQRKKNPRLIPRKEIKVIGYTGENFPEIFTAYPSFNKPNIIDISGGDYRSLLPISEGADEIIRDGRPTGIDLFSGCGGFSLGFLEAGYQILAAVDNERDAVLTYAYNIPNFQESPVHMYLMDITRLTGHEILDNLGMDYGDVDIVFGGPPCKGFSLLNTKTRAPDNPNSKLMWEFIRIMSEIQPKMFLIENVPGLLGFKDFFYLLLESLEKCGYIVRFNKLDAVSYGVPQFRIRILIEGVRTDLNYLPIFPIPTHFDPEALKASEHGFPRADVAVRCFAVHGFSKEEVKDVYWNTKLHIMMNRKTAPETLNKAIDALLAQTAMIKLQEVRERER
jgi:DNA-cytosine methyltransferase